MKSFKVSIILLLWFFIAANAFALEAPKKVVELAYDSLVLYGKDPLIVAVVKGQNRKKKSMVEIKKMDEIWKHSPEVTAFMRKRMESPCAEYLRNIQKSKRYFAEIFLTDNQGAIVAMTYKTSDYWQGDEAKFQRAFKDGVGSVFVDDVEFDQSTQAQLAQVSVPVMDGDKAIGVITFGIEVAKVE